VARAKGRARTQPGSLKEFGKSLPKDRPMSRRQAQRALAEAAALFNAEVLSTTSRGSAAAAFEVHTLRPRDARRDGSRLRTGIDQELLLRPANDRGIALSRTAWLIPFGASGLETGDPGLARKIRSKIHDLFEIGAQVAAASGAKQLQIQVGLPWTATVALTWDLP
jgi:hypothetical protein